MSNVSQSSVIDLDTLVSSKTFETSLYSVGGNLQGIDKVLDGEVKNVFAAVRPPGHHSNSYKCAGFCIFNNIAVGAEYLFREKNIKKVATLPKGRLKATDTKD